MAKADRPRKTSPLNLVSAFELLPLSYNLIKSNFDTFKWLFVPNALLALGATFTHYVDGGAWWRNLDSASGSFIGPDLSGSGIFAAGGFTLIFNIAAIAAYMMLLILSVKTVQNKRPTLKQVWKDLVDSWLWLKLIGLGILMVLIIFIGFILFIVPGIYFLWRLYLAPYVLVDQKVGIKEAMRISWDLSGNFFTAIYGVILVSILLSLTGLLPVIGSLVAFVLTAAYTIAPAYRYQEIKSSKTN